jgi:DNA-binding transcriptional MocR family regulator
MASLAARDTRMIDLSLGFPMASGLEDLQVIAKRAMRNVNSTLFNYDLPHGQWPLRQQIARMLMQQGLEVTPENLIVTNGSKEGLSLALHYYLQPGDWVIVESPTYHGVLPILELESQGYWHPDDGRRNESRATRAIPSHSPSKANLHYQYSA